MGLFETFRKRVKDVEEKAAETLVDAPTETAPVAFQQVKEDAPAPTKAEAAPAAEPPPATSSPPPKPAPKPDLPTAASASPATPKPMRGGKRIDPARVKDILFDLELVLLEADVAMDVVAQVLGDLEGRLEDLRVAGREDIQDAIEDALKAAIRTVLTVGKFDFDDWMLSQTEKPVVVMFVGVNGTGKTTTIGRMAHRLKELGFSPVLAAGDTFRAGAIEQIEKHGDRLGIRTIKHSPGADPGAVAFDALEHAKARKKDIVLLDTAGRMQTNRDLMDELKKVKRIAKPHLTIFVGDALAGNDAINQAKVFDEAVTIDGVVLTKVDTDAKGGAALSIAKAVGKPVMFLGVGQRYEDLIPFDPDWLLARLFDE